MDTLTGLLPDTWIAWITTVVAVCAAVAVALPAPTENSGVVYQAIYRIVQWVALNLGKAKNAQDPAQKTPSDNAKP